MPKKTDYLRELAYVLRKQDTNAKDFGLFDGISWTDKLDRLLAQEGMAGKIVDSKRENTYHRVTPATMRRWSRDAVASRKVRCSLPTPTAWIIDSICYNGEDLVRQEESALSIDLLNTHYMENWIWDPGFPGPAPRMNSLTFTLPAGPMTWEKPWSKHQRYPIDPPTNHH